MDAALDTEDRPDGFDSFESGPTVQEGQEAARGKAGTVQRKKTTPCPLCGLQQVVCQTDCRAGGILVIFLMMTVFFGIMGLAGWILSYIWPVLLWS